MDLLEQMLDHARADKPNEACGLVVARGNKVRLIRALNKHVLPKSYFRLDPDAWLEVEDSEEVIGIYHSHTQTSAEPSLADRSACETSGVPWHIVDLSGQYRRIEPSGFRAPYLRRPYVFRIHDCYSIIRDWFMWEEGIELPDFDREPDFVKRGQNLYVDNFAAAGFVQLREQEVCVGDVFLLQMMNDRISNHAMLYVEPGYVLHHAQDRLSSKEPWGGYWAKHTTHHLRHNAKMGSTNG